jgi:hypothetical protein
LRFFLEVVRAARERDMKATISAKATLMQRRPAVKALPARRGRHRRSD